MTIEEMKARKRELGLSNETLAQLSGIPFSTVQKIFSGMTRSPRQKTIQALEKVLNSPAPYRVKKQGEYTLEDYYAIPDERRAELIDGEIFDMAAPSALHQMILGELYMLFRQFANEHGHPCRVFLSPCDVRLDNDDKTMVQPDLFVLCREFDIKNRCIDGAPDLTVEILSDETRSKDLFLKAYKYENAGVKEYWIIDPGKQEVLVYDFSNEDLIPEKYTFADQIPIHISQGRCRIDFAMVCKAIGI